MHKCFKRSNGFQVLGQVWKLKYDMEDPFKESCIAIESVSSEKRKGKDEVLLTYFAIP